MKAQWCAILLLGAILDSRGVSLYKQPPLRPAPREGPSGEKAPR